MHLNRYTVGSNRSNCYLVGCKQTSEGMIIDPGFDRYSEAEMILHQIVQSGLYIKYILNTHCHTDHMAGNGIVKKFTGASILIHELDASGLVEIPDRWLKRVEFTLAAPPPADKLLREGDSVNVGNLSFAVIHTPGHSKGSISLLGEDLVFTGDALFEGAIGRTDIPGSSFSELINSIESKLLNLPDHLRIYPGHGDASTIGEEKRSNPYLREDLGETPDSRIRKIRELLSSMTVEAIMTPIDEVRQTCRVEDRIMDIREQLEDVRKDVKIIAVVDNEMKLVGSIRPSDLTRARPESRIVKNIMNKNTHGIFLDEKAENVWEELKNHRFVPVIDRMSVLKGFVDRKKIQSGL